MASLFLTTNAHGTHEVSIGEDCATDTAEVLDALVEEIVQAEYDDGDDDTGNPDDRAEYAQTIRDELDQTHFVVDRVEDDDDIAEHFFSSGGVPGGPGYGIRDYIDALESGIDADALSAYLTWCGGNWQGREEFDDHYLGKFTDPKAAVKSIASEFEDSEVPEIYRAYLDWDSICNDYLTNYTEINSHYFSDAE